MFTRSMLNYSNTCKFDVNFDAKIKLQVMHDFVKLISPPRSFREGCRRAERVRNA